MRQLANVRSDPPIEAIVRPFQKFLAVQAAGGALLLVATVVALVWANSPWSSSYDEVWHVSLRIGVGDYILAKPLSFWVNDGLMAIFFFVIGLEIKREFMVGELASLRQAVLPIVAAVGGMAVPACIYAAINWGTDGASGWGIPMATDTAFALGVLALLGSRVPLSLKIFLTALAIIDDIGALTVIAVFYTDEIAWSGLVAAGILLAVLAAANAIGLRYPVLYAGLGVGLWLAILSAGVHPTLAGILLAAMIPAWSRIGTTQFLDQARESLREFEAAGATDESVLANAQRQGTFLALGAIAERAETPLQRLEYRLHPWATFVIMPLFALANAGVVLGSGALTATLHPVGVGIIVGLLIGKPVGIVGLTWLATRGGRMTLPPGLTWRHIAGVGALAGIGFTMSLFVTNLAFAATPLLAIAKVGILAGSVGSGIVGWLVLRGDPAPIASAPTTLNAWGAEH